MEECELTRSLFFQSNRLLFYFLSNSTIFFLDVSVHQSSLYP